jgi:hypothetical protein
MFFKWLVLRKGGVDDGRELADSSDNAVSVAIVQHRVFTVKQFF